MRTVGLERKDNTFSQIRSSGQLPTGKFGCANLHPRFGGGGVFTTLQDTQTEVGAVFLSQGDPYTGLAADGNGDGRGTLICVSTT